MRPTKALKVLHDNAVGSPDRHQETISITVPDSFLGRGEFASLEYFARVEPGEPFNGQVQIEIVWPHSREYILVDSRKDLLEKFPLHDEKIRAVYLWEDRREYVAGDQDDEDAAAYFQTAKFATLLRDLSDHIKESSGGDTAIFIHSSRVEFNLRYDICIKIDGLDDFEKCLSADGDGASCFSGIAKNNLSLFLHDVKHEDQLNALITRANEFIKKTVNDFRIYQHNNTYDQVVKATRQSHVSYMSDLDKVTTALYMKSLVIPIAYIYAGKEISSVKSDPTTLNFVMVAVTIILICTVIVLAQHVSTLLFMVGNIRLKSLEVSLEHGVSVEEAGRHYKGIKARIWIQFGVAIVYIIMAVGVYIYFWNIVKA